MTLPVHIPSKAPDLLTMPETHPGNTSYRLLVDADGGPSSDLCQGVFYLSAGQAESQHRHDVIETVHVLSGSGKAKLEEREIALEPGDTLFLPEGQTHGFQADEDMALLFTFPVPRFADVAYHFTDPT